MGEMAQSCSCGWGLCLLGLWRRLLLPGSSSLSDPSAGFGFVGCAFLLKAPLALAPRTPFSPGSPSQVLHCP